MCWFHVVAANRALRRPGRPVLGVRPSAGLQPLPASRTGPTPCTARNSIQSRTTRA